MKVKNTVSQNIRIFTFEFQLMTMHTVYIFGYILFSTKHIKCKVDWKEEIG